MAIITQNFRLNALANQYASAIYNHVSATSSSGSFTVNAQGQAIKANIVGGIKGVRDLVDGFALEALKDSYPHWEIIAIELLSKCIHGNELTVTGHDIWQSMVNDMGDTVAGNS